MSGRDRPFDASYPLRGEPSAALDVAELVLESSGFDVTRSAKGLHATRQPRGGAFSLEGLAFVDVEVVHAHVTFSGALEGEPLRGAAMSCFIAQASITALLLGLAALTRRPIALEHVIGLLLANLVVAPIVLLTVRLVGAWSRRTALATLEVLAHNMSVAQLVQSESRA